MSTGTSMQSDSTFPQRTNRTLSGKWGVWLLLASLGLVFGVVSLIVMTTPLASNELGLLGELGIKSDGNTEIFVGDRLAGSGTLQVTWNELLGAGHPYELAIPGTNTELLSGDGAQLIWSKSRSPGVHRGTQDVNYRFDELLFQRTDGTLDHVLAITCRFPGAQGRWESLIIPVRVRGTATDPSYFPGFDKLRAGQISRGMIPSRRDNATFDLHLNVHRGSWPTEIDQPASPLWQPDTT